MEEMFKWLKSLGSARKIQELKEDNDYYQVRINVLEQQLSERNQVYREKVGEKEELKEKLERLDRVVTNLNKTLNKIVEVAECNDCGNSRTKVKKILELARFEQTSPSK